MWKRSVKPSDIHSIIGTWVCSCGANIYGAPYIFAPDEQTHVPMMLWMSQGFTDRFRIDRACLGARRDQELSHDNVFHSVLGMLDIDTAVLNPKLDLFHACVRKG